ncbi:sn-glycerol-3-phosphate transport system permease protein UgpA (plasmid) [Burkholderia sp. AD24]|nr:sn-glycerol-3-phosphate transport system permease protein UgpA [Burkholderia sp. AD24]
MGDRYLKYGMLGPALCVCFLTLGYPLVQSFWYALHDWNILQQHSVGRFVGLQNFIDLLHDSDFLASVRTTLLFAVPSIVLTICVSLGLAMLFSGSGWMETEMRTLLVIPFAMAPALVGVSWRFMLSPEFGVIDAVIRFVTRGALSHPVLADPTSAMIALIAIDLWHWAPYFMLMFVGALAALPKETLEAAEIDGAGPLRIFFEVTLPQLKPVLAIAVLLKAIFSLKMLDQVVTLTSGGPGTSTQTLPYFIYQTAFHWYDMGYAAAAAYLLAGVMLVLAMLYSRYILGRNA